MVCLKLASISNDLKPHTGFIQHAPTSKLYRFTRFLGTLTNELDLLNKPSQPQKRGGGKLTLTGLANLVFICYAFTQPDYKNIVSSKLN